MESLSLPQHACYDGRMVRFGLRVLLLSVLVGAASVHALPPPPPPPVVEETLTTAREVGGVLWPAGATLCFRADTKALVRGRVDRLTTPWKAGGVTWPVGTYLDLNARGEVRRASRTLAAVETVGSVRWPAGTQLELEGNGRITLAQRQSVAGETVGGYVFPAGAELVLDGQGKLRSATVYCSDQVFAGVRWKRTTVVGISEDGHITALRALEASETIGKVRWPAGSTLVLDNRGEVLRGTIEVQHAMKLGGVLWPKHTEMQVTPDGKVTKASIPSLSEPTVIRGKRYEAQMHIEFDPTTGEIKRADDPRAIE